MGEGEKELLVQEHQQLRRIEVQDMGIVSRGGSGMEEMAMMRMVCCEMLEQVSDVAVQGGEKLLALTKNMATEL